MKKTLFLLGLLIVQLTNAQEISTLYDTDELHTYFTKAIPADEPGAAILIMKGEKILFSEGYGLADLNLKTKIDENTIFNTGSISKTFVSNAILILEERGKLSLNDPISKYFKNFKNTKIADKVKIKHLLSHTSGLTDARQTNAQFEFYLTAKDVENWHPITQAVTQDFEPGAQFQYSNPAYNGLALIIEQVSGIKWQPFVKENIFKPAGMKYSTITDGPHPKHGVSHGYIQNNQKWEESDYGEVPTFAAAGNGGIWSTTSELALYQIALKNNKFISKEKFIESTDIKQWPSWNSNAAPQIGWSWFIDKTSGGFKTVGHTGSQGGFRSNFVTIPEKEITFVILCNTPRDLMGFSRSIMNWVKKNNWLEKL